MCKRPMGTVGAVSANMDEGDLRPSIKECRAFHLWDKLRLPQLHLAGTSSNKVVATAPPKRLTRAISAPP